MADQLIYDAQANLKEFGLIWEKRAMEFETSHQERIAEMARALAREAVRIQAKLEGMLVTDKRLDRHYDKLKEMRKLKV